MHFMSTEDRYRSILAQDARMREHLPSYTIDEITRRKEGARVEVGVLVGVRDRHFIASNIRNSLAQLKS